MSIFTTEPPYRKSALNIPIMRVGAKGKFGGYSLAAEMLGCKIHYHGRSVPCTLDPGCPLCKIDNVPRWIGYVPVWQPKLARPQLLELPTAAAEYLQQWIQRHGSLKGKLLVASRPGGRVNSRVKLDVETHDTSGLNMPGEPNVKAALCLIWQLNPDHLTASLESKMAEYQRLVDQGSKPNGHASTEPVRTDR